MKRSLQPIARQFCKLKQNILRRLSGAKTGYILARQEIQERKKARSAHLHRAFMLDEYCTRNILLGYAPELTQEEKDFLKQPVPILFTTREKMSLMVHKISNGFRSPSFV